MKAQGLMEQWNSAIDIRLLLAHGVESTGTVCKVVKARSTKVRKKITCTMDSANSRVSLDKQSGLFGTIGKTLRLGQ